MLLLWENLAKRNGCGCTQMQHVTCATVGRAHLQLLHGLLGLCTHHLSKPTRLAVLSREWLITSSSVGHPIISRNTTVREQQTELTTVSVHGTSGNLFQQLMNIVEEEAVTAGGSGVGAPCVN